MRVIQTSGTSGSAYRKMSNFGNLAKKRDVITDILVKKYIIDDRDILKTPPFYVSDINYRSRHLFVLQSYNRKET
jgi:hypothetical protein